MRKLIGPFLFCILFFFLGALFEGAGERNLPPLLAPYLWKPASVASLRKSPHRRKARNAGDVYRHPRAIYACVSFFQKIFCFAKSFLGALSYEPPLCKGRWQARNEPVGGVVIHKEI